MTTTCYECGGTGHFARDCTYKQSAQSIALMKREPTEPTADYLAAREAMGEPTSGPEILSAGCPWCHVPAYRRCVNVGTGRETDPHYERQAAAGIERPSIRLLEQARRQVDESRRARLVT